MLTMPVRRFGPAFSPFCLFRGIGHLGFSRFFNSSNKAFAASTSIRRGSTYVLSTSARYSKYTWSFCPSSVVPAGPVRCPTPNPTPVMAAAISATEYTRTWPLLRPVYPISWLIVRTLAQKAFDCPTKRRSARIILYHPGVIRACSPTVPDYYSELWLFDGAPIRRASVRQPRTYSQRIGAP